MTQDEIEKIKAELKRKYETTRAVCKERNQHYRANREAQRAIEKVNSPKFHPMAVDNKFHPMAVDNGVRTK